MSQINEIDGQWILWRWKDRTTNHWHKHRVQEVTQTDSGIMLNLTDRTFDTKYPTMILLSEIEYLIPVVKSGQEP